MKRIYNSIARLSFAAVVPMLFAVGAFPQAPSATKTPFVMPSGMSGASMDDPRAKLSPGLFDAGEAAMGIKHLMLLKKPEAFQLGTDPNGPQVGKALTAMGIPDVPQIPASVRMSVGALALANSDLAFQGNYLFLGNFFGINIYDIADPAKAKLVTSLLCPGGQGDVTVFKNLMFMSVEMPNGRLDCGAQSFPLPTDMSKLGGMPAAEKDRFRGIRIFDISDITKPKQVAAVQTCRGSHTHTLVLDPKDNANVYLYNSGASFVRSDAELAGCSNTPPEQDPKTSRFSIDIIKVPMAAPQDAKIVASPRLFAEGARLMPLTTVAHMKTRLASRIPIIATTSPPIRSWV